MICFHECCDLDDASEGWVGELPTPKGAMERGGEMGDGSRASRFDFKKDFIENGANLFAIFCWLGSSFAPGATGSAGSNL